MTTAFCIAVGVSTVAGAAAGAAGYIAATKLMGEEIDPKSLVVSAAGGAVAGALAPVIAVFAPVAAIVPATLGMYGTVSALQYAADQTWHGQPVEATTAAASFAVGAVAGTIGGAYSPFDEIGREGMTQGLRVGMSFGQTAFQGEREVAMQFLQYQVVNGGITLARNFVATTGATVVQTVINGR